MNKLYYMDRYMFVMCPICYRSDIFYDTSAFKFHCTFLTLVYCFVVCAYIFVCSSYFMSEPVIAVLLLSQLNECIKLLAHSFPSLFLNHESGSHCLYSLFHSVPVLHTSYVAA